MAEITDLRLSVGRSTGGREFARIRGRVAWTARETQLNKYYLLRGFLVEQDDSRDFFDTLPDGNIHWHSIGNLDDYIGRIFSMWIRPNGQRNYNFNERRDWNFPNNEWGEEEYISVVTVVPEDHSDVAFSNRVDINLA